MDGVRRILVIAMGKAAGPMLRAVLARQDIVGGRTISGVLVAPDRPAWLPASVQYFRGGHPEPDERSRDAAECILGMLHDEPPSEGTLCLFLVSGGASAMVELPLDPIISVEDTAAFHRALVHSAAPIVQINALRKHFSAVKGGRLALAARHLRSISLLVSDVPPGQLDALSSGPTLPDRSTVADCRAILREHDLSGHLPASVTAFFQRESLPETPKPGDLDPNALLILSQADLAEHAAQAARERGYSAVIDNTPDDWPAAEAAQYLLDRFRSLQSQQDRSGKGSGRLCLISTGEVVVRLPPGLQGRASGGRNQHFVLETATRLSESDGDIAVLSCGSDGIDGNSPAAGAVIASADFRSAEARHRALEALGRFSAHPLLRRMGAAIETGATGLNLRDLRMILR